MKKIILYEEMEVKIVWALRAEFPSVLSKMHSACSNERFKEGVSSPKKNNGYLTSKFQQNFQNCSLFFERNALSKRTIFQRKVFSLVFDFCENIFELNGKWFANLS